MAGATITSHPSGPRRTRTRPRPAPSRRAAVRRRPPVAGSKKRRGSGRGSRRGSRRGPAWYAKRWWPALLVVVAVLVGAAWNSGDDGVGAAPGHCTVAGLSMTLTAEQVANAQTVADVGRQRGLPERAVVIALATAQQESRLRNLDHGDRDSLGMFQQRPSAGWGTEAQVQDPVYAANTFYDHLVEVPGWDTARLTDAAQTVQRSAFPEAYQQWEEMATKLAAAQIAPFPPAITCAPDGVPTD